MRMRASICSALILAAPAMARDFTFVVPDATRSTHNIAFYQAETVTMTVHGPEVSGGDVVLYDIVAATNRLTTWLSVTGTIVGATNAYIHISPSNSNLYADNYSGYLTWAQLDGGGNITNQRLLVRQDVTVLYRPDARYTTHAGPLTYAVESDGVGATNAVGSGRLTLGYDAVSGTITGRVDIADIEGSTNYWTAGVGAWLSSVAQRISSAHTSNWTMAYGWGDHATAGYATGTPLYVESDPAWHAGTGALWSAIAGAGGSERDPVWTNAVRVGWTNTASIRMSGGAGLEWARDDEWDLLTSIDGHFQWAGREWLRRDGNIPSARITNAVAELGLGPGGAGVDTNASYTFAAGTMQRFGGISVGSGAGGSTISYGDSGGLLTIAPTTAVNYGHFRIGPSCNTTASGGTGAGVAIGRGAASLRDSFVFSSAASTGDLYSIAFHAGGHGARNYSVVLGAAAQGTNEAVAIGLYASALGTRRIAIGSSASNTVDESVLLRGALQLWQPVRLAAHPTPSTNRVWIYKLGTNSGVYVMGELGLPTLIGSHNARGERVLEDHDVVTGITRTRNIEAEARADVEYRAAEIAALREARGWPDWKAAMLKAAEARDAAYSAAYTEIKDGPDWSERMDALRAEREADIQAWDDVKVEPGEEKPPRPEPFKPLPPPHRDRDDEPMRHIRR